jgi:RNA polymerase sigma factor (sigma-70 family)
VDINAQLAEKRPVIDRIARSFVRRHGWIEYDDAVQIVTLEAWEVLRDRGDGAGDPDAEIRMRGCRRLFDELRTGRVTGVSRSNHANGSLAALSLNVRVARNEDSSELLELLADAADPYEPVDLENERDILARQVAEALTLLPERERFIVWLHYYEGIVQREIAEIEGVSESCVSQLLNKARDRMRERLTEAA